MRKLIFLALILSPRLAAAEAKESGCLSFLEFVPVEATEVIQRANEAAGLLTELCRRAGFDLPPAALDARELDALAELESLQANALVRARPSLHFSPPLIAVRLKPHVIQGAEFLGELGRMWFVAFDDGNTALVDTGADETILSSDTATREQTRIVRSVGLVRSLAGELASASMERGGVRVSPVFTSPDVRVGLLGRDFLELPQVLCLDWEAKVMMLAHCNARESERLKTRFYEGLDGSPVVILEEPDGRSTAALLDTGTLLSTSFNRECAGPQHEFGSFDVMSGVAGSTDLSVSKVEIIAFGLGSSGRDFSEAFVCEADSGSPQYAILGMSFLNRFAAMEIDFTERTVSLFP